jgi:hypothetical protein
VGSGTAFSTKRWPQSLWPTMPTATYSSIGCGYAALRAFVANDPDKEPQVPP